MKGVIVTEIAKGRREYGYEVGLSAQGGLSPQSFTVGLTVNNDADFYATRLLVGQFGSDQPLDPRITVQIKDASSDDIWFRQAGDINQLADMLSIGPGSALTGLSWSKIIRSAARGLPAPLIIRRGTSIFFSFTNLAALTLKGDVYCGFEGFRVYPAEPEPVPNEVRGFLRPFSWNGTLTAAASAVNAVAKLGTITMNGLGPGHYILKNAYISTTKINVVDPGPAGPPANTDSSPFIGAQFWTTRGGNKRRVHITNPSAVGDFVPFSFLTGGGLSRDWAHPIYVEGTDSVYVDLFANTTWFATNTPGTIEVGFNGYRIP